MATALTAVSPKKPASGSSEKSLHGNLVPGQLGPLTPAGQSCRRLACPCAGSRVDLISPRCSWAHLSTSDPGPGHPRSAGAWRSQVDDIWDLSCTSYKGRSAAGEDGVCLAMFFVASGPRGPRCLWQRWLGYRLGKRCPKGLLLEEGSRQGVSRTEQGPRARKTTEECYS